MRTWVAVSFYTPDYKEDADRLVNSLKKFNVLHDVVKIDKKSGAYAEWMNVCNKKAAFIKQKMVEHAKDVVWVDADSELVAEPVYFDVMQEDVAVYYENMIVARAGTIYFKNNERAVSVLDRWDKNSQAMPSVGDQKHLENVLTGAYFHSKGVTVHFLPDSYYHIFDLDKNKPNPVLVHYQHSRKIRKSYELVRGV